MSRQLLCLSLVTLALLGLSLTLTSAVASCSSNYVFLGNACFAFIRESKTAASAMAYCRHQGATLASIDSELEKNAVINNVNVNYPGQYWTSGTNKIGRYVWGNTNTQVPVAWRGRPFRQINNMCVYLCSFTRKFWEASCSATRNFICKRSIQRSLAPVDAN